ncbi:MAG: L,D-transpeptidase [Syntrophobacteraceae bacterium]
MKAYRFFPTAIVALTVAVWLAIPGVLADNLWAADSGDGPRGGAGWKERVLTARELDRVGARDPDLSPSIAKRLLARLNARDFDYIDEDIRNGRTIRVPNDFTAFKTWTPLPKYLPEVAGLEKFILIAKDIPFIGWYERGRLVGDTYICIGKREGMTAAGIYTVKEKDRNHVSRSYPNAYGQPAPMPWALRIYELVWIHAGDITGGYCSHGCVNLPLFPAMKLFDWATRGTPVMIVESLREVPTVMVNNRSNCALFASACAPPKAARERAG